ncbi:MAG TPA: TolC family protein, partial [bacterium]|nr:TolC family protein [bacterium]
MYKLFAGILAVSITLVSPVITAGQVDQPEELTSLQAAIEIVLERNPAVRGAEASWQAALREIPVAGVWPEPSLTLTQFARSVETRNGPQLQQVALNQMIPLWGTTGLRRSIALRKAQKAEQDYRAVRLRVRSQVKSIWSDLYWVDASLDALREYQNLLETFREIAETRYSTGQGLQTSVLKARVEISNLEEKILNFGEMRTTFVHNLNSALNRPIDAPVA